MKEPASKAEKWVGSLVSFDKYDFAKIGAAVGCVAFQVPGAAACVHSGSPDKSAVWE